MGRGGENNSSALSHNDFLIIYCTGNTAHLSSDGCTRLCATQEPLLSGRLVTPRKSWCYFQRLPGENIQGILPQQRRATFDGDGNGLQMHPS